MGAQHLGERDVERQEGALEGCLLVGDSLPPRRLGRKKRRGPSTPKGPPTVTHSATDPPSQTIRGDAPDRAGRAVRPRVRARLVRRRVRRAAGRDALARDARSGRSRALENLEHRGAAGADPLTGDGAGMLLQLPDEFFRGVDRPRSCRRPARTASASASCRADDEARRAELEQHPRRRGRGRGPARDLLARRPDASSSTIGDTAREVAPDRPAARRRRLATSSRPTATPSSASSTSSAGSPRSRAGPDARDPELLGADDRLQGDADGAAARAGATPTCCDERMKSALVLSTRASRRTPSRAGSSRTRTG